MPTKASSSPAATFATICHWQAHGRAQRVGACARAHGHRRATGARWACGQTPGPNCGADNGEIRDYIANASLISLEGQSRSHAVWIATDVTEAGLAEKALRESEARFANLFEMSPMPTSYSFDTDDYSTFYRNAAFYQTFGFDPQTDAAKSTSELNFWVNPEDVLRARDIRVSGKPVDNWQVQVRHADGRHRWVAIFGRFIVEARRTMVITTLLDITEQRLAQQTVEDLNATLERRVHERTAQLEHARDNLVQSEKLASLGALVAGVAHEINTPVGNGLIVASSLDERVREFATGHGPTDAALAPGAVHP
jgi:PAS domain S-box-containing protein